MMADMVEMVEEEDLEAEWEVGTVCFGSSVLAAVSVVIVAPFLPAPHTTHKLAGNMGGFGGGYGGNGYGGGMGGGMGGMGGGTVSVPVHF